MKSITSRQNPIVARFRALAEDTDPSGTRVLLDGIHIVRDAHEAGLQLEVVAVSSSQLDAVTEISEYAQKLQNAEVDVIRVADAVFPALSPVRTPSGLVAIAVKRPSSVAEICGPPDAFVLLVVDVQDPGNVGALARTAEAGGCTGVIVAGSSANPFAWKAIRGSMGSALRLPLVGGIPTSTALSCLRAAGIRSLAAIPRGGTPVDHVDWHGKVGIVLGSEGAGLSDAVISQCDEVVSIPMAPQVESLNVSAAGAILIYAARHGRNKLDH